MRFLWLGILIAAPAQALQVVAEIEPAPARAGERVQLTLRVSSDSRAAVKVQDLGLGSFSLISKGGSSSSTQMTFSGGRRNVVHSSVHRFVLRAPQSPGDYPLGPVKVSAGAQVGQSAQVPVRVVSAGDVVRGAKNTSEELFVDFTVDPPEPFVGQQFTVTAHVYSRVRLEGVADLDFPEAKGVWWEQLESPSRAGSEVVVYSGRRYRRHMVGRIAGFAEREGELVLTGGEAAVQVMQGDLFFGGLKEKTLYANPVTLNVQALPPDARATQVGRYSVRHGYIANRLNLGDVIELKVTVKGDGNIKAFPLPEVRLAPGLRGFTPKRDVVMNEGSTLIGGTLTWVLPIQATVPGKHRLQAMDVRWFDPDKQSIRTARVGPFEFDVVGTLTVPKGDPAAQADSGSAHPLRGPIGSFRSERMTASWLAHPGAILILALLVLLLWLPRTVRSVAGPEEIRRGDLELALEAALGVPVRGLGRNELLDQAAQALGVERAAELDEQLSALDAAAYGPSEQTAEAIKARLVVWLGASS